MQEPPTSGTARSPSPEPRVEETSTPESFAQVPLPPVTTADEDSQEDEVSLGIHFDDGSPMASKRSTSSRRESMLRNPPTDRTQESFVKSGLRQSMGKFREADLDTLPEEELDGTYTQRTLEEGSNGAPIIDGRALTVSARAKDVVNLGCAFGDALGMQLVVNWTVHLLRYWLGVWLCSWCGLGCALDCALGCVLGF